MITNPSRDAHPAADGQVRARPAGRLAGRAAWAAGAIAVAAALFACYLRQSRTISVGSDGASQALQAWDMIHGNPLLHGWWVTDVSFYTTELPQYALIEFARGLSADVIHVAGAMTYTLLVLAAAALARGRATGRAGMARALVAGGIMLAPSLGPGTQTLVLSPDHTGTAVPILATWLLIDRAPARWYVPVLAWLALSLTALADAITVFVAIIPLALACALQIGRGFLAHPRTPPRVSWHTVGLLAAAVLAVPTEMAGTALIRALGGWQVNGLSAGLASAGQLAANARLAGQSLLELFGADVFGAASSGSRSAVVFAVIHLAGAVAAAAGVAAAARSLIRRRDSAGQPDLIVTALLAGIVIDVAAFAVGVQAVNILSAREIAPVLPFAAVLAGRFPGGRLAASQPGTSRIAWYSLFAVLAAYAAMLGYAAARPAAPPQYAALAGWLRAHHLASGLSGYHQANIVTLESGGAVTLRTAVSTHRGHLAGSTWNASTTWFDPATHAASYLVLTPTGLAGAAGGSGFAAAEAVRTFGHPARTLRYQGYQILIWRQGENLLARLRQRS